jgi:hypothetical protein
MLFATLVLEVYGAAAATVSLVVAGLAYRSSRDALRLDVPSLEVTTSSRLSGDEEAAVDVHVANVGKRPTTVTGVGIRYEVDPRLPGYKGPLGSVMLTNPFDFEDHELGPGQVAHFSLEFGDRPLPCHADTPMRAWAQDIHGAVVSAAPEVFIRGWLDSGWIPPAGTPEDRI